MAWYTAASSGATCVAAYDAIGAVDLADSYVNEVNPGTNNAAPGTAPTWAAGTGWTFNGTTQYLTTGLTPTSTYSMIVRFSGATVDGTIRAFAGSGDGTNARFGITQDTTSSGRVFYLYANLSTARTGSTLASGVYAMTASQGYKDGAAHGASYSTTWGSGATEIWIGCMNRSGFDRGYIGSIAALALYSGTIDATDVTTITAAMNALGAAGQPTTLRHGATGRRLFGPRIGAGGW